MISVVMPAYNSAAFIRPAVDSVLAQTYPHFELLVCDNGSTDGTQAIVEEYARRDRRVRLLQHGFRTSSENCNAAFPKTRFPWVARLDSDDIAMPDRFERQIRAADEDPSVVVWGGYVMLINRDGVPLRISATGPTSDAELEAQREAGRLVLVQAPSTMYRRDVLLEVGGYDRRFDTAEDIDLHYRMMRFGPLRVIPEVVCQYRVHGTSNTARRAMQQEHLVKYIKLRDRVLRVGGEVPSLEDYFKALAERPVHQRVASRLDGVARQFYRNASLHHSNGALLQAVLCLTAATALSPRNSLLRLATGWHGRWRAGRNRSGRSRLA